MTTSTIFSGTAPRRPSEAAGKTGPEPGASPGGGIDWLGHLLQLTDSAYPTGAFAHSAGLEGMVQLGQVENPVDLERFVADSVFAGLEGADLPLVRFSREAALDGDGRRIGELDELAAALRTPEELRLASTRSGRQRRDLMVQVMHLDERFPGQWAELTRDLRHTQLPVIAGIEAALLGLPLDAALQAYAFGTVSAVLSAALKILRLGQTTIQEILHRQAARLPELIERSRQIESHQVGTFTPLLDIASARHKRAYSRLFLS